MGTRKRASLSADPLAQPDSLIHMLVNRVQDYLHFPVPDPLYVVLGAVAANMMMGPPVWIVLIGAPSSGRTVLLMSLAGLAPVVPNMPGVHIIGGGIKGAAAFLSGTAKKERARGSTGGLLPQIGHRGILVMKDFSSILSLQRDVIIETVDVLRQSFDGFYSRPVGSDGGVHLEWHGRIGFLAASTNAIDRHSNEIGELGERWMYYRYPASDGYGETIKALGVDDPDEMMSNLKALVSNFFDALSVQWDEERRALTQNEKNRLYAMASLSVAARSAVPRDKWHGDEVDDIAQKEGPPRIATELGQLLLGLERIGLETSEAWRIIGKVALDSVRQARMKLLQMAYEGKDEVPELRRELGIGNRVMDILVDDLVIHGVLERLPGRGEKKIGLTSWTRKQFDLGWGDKQEADKGEWE